MKHPILLNNITNTVYSFVILTFENIANFLNTNICGRTPVKFVLKAPGKTRLMPSTLLFSVKILEDTEIWKLLFI